MSKKDLDRLSERMDELEKQVQCLFSRSTIYGPTDPKLKLDIELEERLDKLEKSSLSDFEGPTYRG